MCVVSMVGDHYNDKWQRWYPYVQQQTIYTPNPLKKELDELKKEVEDLKALLKRAKEYDKANNEPDCEIEDKMVKLRAVAKLVGIDLDDVLKKK